MEISERDQEKIKRMNKESQDRIKRRKKEDQEKIKKMKKWDGTEPTGRFEYPWPDHLIDNEYNLMIDEDGTVYYLTKEEEPELRIWCIASKLTEHLHYLEQIKER